MLLQTFYPEIFIASCLLQQLIFNSTLILDKKTYSPLINKEVFSQIFFIFLCIIVYLNSLKLEGTFLISIFFNDLSNIYLKTILSFIFIFLVFFIKNSYVIQKLNFFEYFIILLFVFFSMLLLFSCSDLLSVYLIIELQALSFYILASFRRISSYSNEAGLKYFISGSFFSGTFLLGCSILYISTGTLNFNMLNILFFFPIESENFFLILFITISSLLILFSFFFKLSVAPFHFWAPDVYEGSPLASTIIFSLIPKISILTFIIKWVSLFYFILISKLSFILIFSGLCSILFGTIFAIQQVRIKRFIIYSSIAQIGFIIIALGNYTFSSLISIYFFLFTYLLTSTLIWGKISLFYFFQTKIKIFFKYTTKPIYFSNFSNLFKFNNTWAFSFIIIFFSLAGVPPLIGFFAKAFILFTLIKSESLILVCGLVLLSAISTFYYLKIVKIIFFESKRYLNEVQINTVSIFKSSFLYFEVLFLVLFLFSLIFLFFFPCYLFLICNLIILNSFFIFI